MSRMTLIALTFGFAVALTGSSRAQDEGTKAATAAKDAGSGKDAKQEILDLSKQKWTWMAERNIEALEGLFYEESYFTHMSGSMTRKEELETIKSGRIEYKKADVEEVVSVRVVGTTAIHLSKIRLQAVVGGNEVTTPFTVTEVYFKLDGKWKLAQLTFSVRRGS